MRKGFLIAMLGVLVWYAGRPRDAVVVPPVSPAAPHRPWRPLRQEAAAGKEHVNGPESGGVSVRCDLPTDLHLKNKGGMGPRGPGTGAGLCVFTSIDHAARWANVPELIGLRDYMTKFPGGGYPEKVRQYIAKLSKERGHELKEGVDYGQSTTADESVIAAVLDGYRMACVTYGYSPRYGQNIAHMVNMVMLDKDWGVILDNNFPGTYEWVPRAEVLRRWKMMQGGWIFWLSAPPPPPIPVNQ